MPTKTPSIISTVLTVLTLLVIGAASMFISLIGLNGFSERAATPALITSLVCNGLSILLATILAWRLPQWLITRFNWNKAGAVLVSVLVSGTLGGALSIITVFIGILIAQV